MKPKLKPPGNKRLKLKRDVLFSKFAFKFNLRHYNVVPLLRRNSQQQQCNADLLALVASAGAGDASSDVDEDEVRRFRLNSVPS
jgi:hypothetical protein